MDIANSNDRHIYIKSAGSLDDGLEIGSHPMSLNYHQNFCWQKIMRKVVALGYRSHQTSTCGLHIHVNRSAFGMNQAEQEEVIAKILYFVEAHWNELYYFSRREVNVFYRIFRELRRVRSSALPCVYPAPRTAPARTLNRTLTE